MDLQNEPDPDLGSRLDKNVKTKLDGSRVCFACGYRESQRRNELNLAKITDLEAMTSELIVRMNDLEAENRQLESTLVKRLRQLFDYRYFN